MKNQHRLRGIIWIGSVTVLFVIILLIAAGLGPMIPETDSTHEETTLQEVTEDPVKIAAGSVFRPGQHRRLDHEDGIVFQQYVDLGLYEAARWYAQTESQVALLEEKGPQTRKVARQQFSDLPEDKQAAIQSAWIVLEKTNLHKSGPEWESFQTYVRYEGTFGDDCQIFTDDWMKAWPRVTADSKDNYLVDGILIPCHETLFYVYRQDEWMGLNIAYERGYLTQEDLRELISVIAGLESVPASPSRP
ncbi:MAG: hypothetical protein ILP12_01575 [Lachnospiraceae bacterium]|nr:hypothetical protein [Lachnospiraceae bacterium]